MLSNGGKVGEECWKVESESCFGDGRLRIVGARFLANYLAEKLGVSSGEIWV